MKPLPLVLALAQIGAGRYLARPTTLYSVPVYRGAGGIFHSLPSSK